MRCGCHGNIAENPANCEITHAILSQLLLSQATLRHDRMVKGGLAPAMRRRLADYLDTHLHQPLSLAILAQIACMSEYHLARMFRISFGMPPYSWIAQRRIDHVCRLLKTTAQPLQQIADCGGCADLSHFSHCFSLALGVPPTRYRQLLA